MHCSSLHGFLSRVMVSDHEIMCYPLYDRPGAVILAAEVYWFWAPSLCLPGHTTLTPQSSSFNFIFAFYCWLILLVEHYSTVQVQRHKPAALIISDLTQRLFTSIGAILFVCTITPSIFSFSFLTSFCAHCSRVASHHPVRDQASLFILVKELEHPTPSRKYLADLSTMTRTHFKKTIQFKADYAPSVITEYKSQRTGSQRWQSTERAQ